LRAALTSVVVTAALPIVGAFLLCVFQALDSPGQFVPGMVGGLSVAGRAVSGPLAILGAQRGRIPYDATDLPATGITYVWAANEASGYSDIPLSRGPWSNYDSGNDRYQLMMWSRSGARLSLSAGNNFVDFAGSAGLDVTAALVVPVSGKIGDIKLYLDGVEQGVSSYYLGTAATTNTTVEVGSTPLYLGGRSNSGGTQDFYYNFLRVYNEPLSAAQITNDYNGVYADSLTVHIDKRTGWRDISGNGNDVIIETP
jgi:hypothetical protein